MFLKDQQQSIPNGRCCCTACVHPNYGKNEFLGNPKKIFSFEHDKHKNQNKERYQAKERSYTERISYSPLSVHVYQSDSTHIIEVGFCPPQRKVCQNSAAIFLLHFIIPEISTSAYTRIFCFDVFLRKAHLNVRECHNFFM